MGDKVWTSDMIAFARDLWDVQKLSASEVAQRIQSRFRVNITKSSVASAVRRYKFEPRESPIKRLSPEKRGQRKPLPKPLTKPAELPAKTEAHTEVHLEPLAVPMTRPPPTSATTRPMCLWQVWWNANARQCEPGETCDKAAAPGSRYCARHHRLVAEHSKIEQQEAA